ncbi:MAG: hypothetical protein K5656_12455 [Lachnospiraceae bacterium]|nr:hypothetical protein [Lachnospiraceae bacterium]
MRNRLFKITVVTLLAAFVASIIAYIALARYEKGLLDVCSVQQDNYVQLVLDQINLEKDRSDDEIISNILSTLNSSTSRYWTFSKGESILFVKDVLETDKYKSFAADNYYKSESAKAFIESLTKGEIIHDTILVNNVEYIASGTMFEYNGNDYELCLLTNDCIFLENNRFLSAKVELIILIVFLISILIIVPIAMTQANVKLSEKLEEVTENEKILANNVVLLNDQLEERNIYDSRRNLFTIDLIDEFIEKLSNRENALPILNIRFKCSTDNGEVRLLDTTNLVFGKSALRFKDVYSNEIVVLVLKHGSLIHSEKETLYNMKHADITSVKVYYTFDELKELLPENRLFKEENDGKSDI